MRQTVKPDSIQKTGDLRSSHRSYIITKTLFRFCSIYRFSQNKYILTKYTLNKHIY